MLGSGVFRNENVFMRNLPILSFILSGAALCFQVLVLYPWHEELSIKFKVVESSMKELEIALQESLALKKDEKIHQEAETSIKSVENTTVPHGLEHKG